MSTLIFHFSIRTAARAAASHDKNWPHSGSAPNSPPPALSLLPYLCSATSVRAGE